MSSNTCSISERVQDRTKVTMTDRWSDKKSHKHFRLLPKSTMDDVKLQKCSVAGKNRFMEPTRKI